MYSGHPLGLFPSSPSAPRAIITNGMMIPNYSTRSDNQYKETIKNMAMRDHAAGVTVTSDGPRGLGGGGGVREEVGYAEVY